MIDLNSKDPVKKISEYPIRKDGETRDYDKISFECMPLRAKQIRDIEEYVFKKTRRPIFLDAGGLRIDPNIQPYACIFSQKIPSISWTTWITIALIIANTIITVLFHYFK